MKQYIAFDSQKQYTLAEREEVTSRRATQCRIEHFPGAIRRYLRDCPAGTLVAVEATQFPVDATISPRIVFLSHTQNQVMDHVLLSRGRTGTPLG